MSDLVSEKMKTTVKLPDLRMSNVKNYDFVYDYYSDVTLLITAIKEYHRVKRIPKGENDLLSILK